MSADGNLAAGQWFDRGTQAMNARQWEYGVECLSQAVRMHPESAEYRRAKYRCCRKMHKASEKSGHRRSVKLVDIRRKLLQARLTKDWVAVDRWAEEGITAQPWDAPFFAQVATACTELEYAEAARYVWALAVKLDRSNIQYNRQFGRLLAAERDYDGAMRCFRRILDEDPADRYAVEMIRYIDVERLIHSKGYNGAEATRNIPSPVTQESGDDPAASPPHGPAVNTVGSRELSDADRAPDRVTSSGEQLTVQLRLSRLSFEQRRWKACVEACQKALRISPDDMITRERMEDAQLSLMRDNLEQIQRAASREVGSRHLAEQAAVLERQLVEKRIAVLKERVARHHSDLKLRFELADQYSRLGQYREAIPLFQAACQSPKLREESLLRLGQCWICDGKKDLACRQFQLALRSLSPLENPDVWKTAHYWLGRLKESDGRSKEAESHYAEVLLVEYGYRDAVSRLEALQSGAVSASSPDV